MSEAAEAPQTGDVPCSCEPCKARAQKRNVRAWRWMAGLDLTKPPAPMLRWFLLLILGLSCWAAELPLNVRAWLGPIIIAGALILPDVAGFGIAGVRLDLKKTQDEIATLKLRIDMRQQVIIYGALERSTQAQTGEDAPKQPRFISVPHHGARR
jgi:hypothetical protein